MSEGTMISEGNNRFLRIEEDENAELGYKLKMIHQNEPAQLLRVSVSREAHKTILDYYVTGLVPLRSFEDNNLLDYLYATISALARLTDTLKEYLLDFNDIDLSPDHIFVRKETGAFYFTYRFCQGAESESSLRALMEFFVKKSNPVETRDVVLVYGMYQRSREEGTTPQSLLQYWKEMHNEERAHIAEGQAYRAETKAAMEEQRIYDSLGIELKQGETSFDAWKKAQVDESSDVVEIPTKPERRSAKKSTGFDKFKKAVKNHLLEIGLGVVAFVVSLIALLS